MIIDPITSSIVTGIVVSLFSGIILVLLRRRWQNIDKKEIKKQAKDEELEVLKKFIVNAEKSIWRLNKTVLIMAKIIDDQTEKAHGDLNSSLEDIATELLRESNKS